MSVYNSYFKAVDSFAYIVFIVVMFFCAQGLVSAVDLYISQWWVVSSDKESVRGSIEQNSKILFPIRSNWEEQIATEKLNAMAMANSTNVTRSDVVNDNDDSRTNYIITYAILMVVATYVYVHRTFAFFLMCMRASVKLHDKLFRGVTRATMFFYNNNPSGRILNRFSRDINNIDTLLPPSMMDCISVSWFLYF